MEPKPFAGRRVLVVLGTRPEAIKLAPVIAALKARPGLRTLVCATGQHRELLAEATRLFDIPVDIDLRLMRPAQRPDEFLGEARAALTAVITRCAPALTIVQGDTATAFAAAQASAACGVPVGHVEAGLRSGDAGNPFSEEVYRCAISRLATLHFAPTRGAREALLAEGTASERVHVTGNSGIDALHTALVRIDADDRVVGQVRDLLDPQRKLVLVTTHRRESFGRPLASIVEAVRRLAGRDDTQVLLPVHPNPVVRETVERGLGSVANVRLVAPLGYYELIYCLRRARLVLTDSGGLQEEAPAVGVPVLVMRNTTERPEGIATGNARLVGTETEAIVEVASRLLDDDAAHAAMATARSPYGDGHAGRRIAAIVSDWLTEATVLRRQPALA